MDVAVFLNSSMEHGGGGDHDTIFAVYQDLEKQATDLENTWKSIANCL